MPTTNTRQLFCKCPRATVMLLVATLSVLIPIQSIQSRGIPALDKSEASHLLRSRQVTASPRVIHTAHGRGNIQLAIANNGTFGTYGEAIADPFTGEMIPSCEYPRNSDITFLWIGAFWIGAIVDRDTLVSCGSEDFYETNEFWPDLPELGGEFVYSSIDVNSKFYNPNIEAYSEEDIVCEYYDTLTDASMVGRDPTDARGHKPLGLKITQRSMAWSYEYADDFILFDYNIENIGTERLRKTYIGIWVDGDAFHITRNNPSGWDDDMAGFYESHPAPEGCGFIDTVNIAWHADNDGDPVPEDAPVAWDFRSAKGVVGARVVRTPSDSLNYSYNWWIIDYQNPGHDFGPRRVGTTEQPFRDFGYGLGTPPGDLNKYYVMSHEEFDYDLMETALNHSSEGWLPPPPDAESFATGYDCRYLLSFGPFDIEPGQTLPVTFAWIGGEDLHQGPTDFANLFDPAHPEHYYSSLDFSNLAHNSRWASWVYDNPGVDTDGDGFYGNARYCVTDTGSPGDSGLIDTFWYQGDGVPDFRGAGPPPAPKIRLIPSNGKLVVRFNGYHSETTRDIFTGKVDFEGYRIYAALDERPSSFSVLRSYDRENYKSFVWVDPGGGNGLWKQLDDPSTLEELRLRYGNPVMEPLGYSRAHPLQFDGKFYFFEKQDHNQFELDLPDGITKVYPNAINPGGDSSLWQDEDLVFDYNTPLPKFYEYEYVYGNLLPTVPYYVAVTAFDFGSPSSGLASLETKPINNFVRELPLTPADSVEKHGLDAYVYPNPYRVDGAYSERGFENRYGSLIPERARLINFVNLPKVCTISIFSLDGDLVRQIDHNYPNGGPGSMHETWDLITRNTQAVVSGLYLWVIESDQRTQIGKLVVIK